jgi:hypothetical protein
MTAAARRRLVPSSKKGAGTSRALALISGGLAIFGLVVIVLYAASTPGRSIRYIGVGVLTAIAALVTGCLLGFLFGVPKVVSSGELRHRRDAPTEVTRTQTPDTTVTTSTIPPSSTPSTSVESTTGDGASTGTSDDSEPAGANAGNSGSTSPFEPSTNLSEVSDWLTKLLLGAGLVELTHLGGPLGKLINAVAFGLGRSAAVGVPDSAAQVMAGSLLITYFVLGFLDGYVLTTLWYGSKVRGL